MEKSVYTIGHSTHSISYFIDLLQQHHIHCIIDVRSVPASGYNPQYNQSQLKASLAQHQILYMHFKDEFGAHQKQKDYRHEDGFLDFDKFALSTTFQRGVRRIQEAIKQGYRIALMCAEADPLVCHRFSMVAKNIQRAGIEVKHILKDGHIHTHTELEATFMVKYNPNHKQLKECKHHQPKESTIHKPIRMQPYS